VGTVLFGLGLMIRYSPLPEYVIPMVEYIRGNSGKLQTKKNIFLVSTFDPRCLLLFFSCRHQVIAIDTIIGYAVSMNVSLLEAKSLSFLHSLCNDCGYTLGIITIPKYIRQVNACDYVLF
jgi:hypothetical protein